VPQAPDLARAYRRLLLVETFQRIGEGVTRRARPLQLPLFPSLAAVVAAPTLRDRQSARERRVAIFQAVIWQR
jgi:hypothetical protein